MKDEARGSIVNCELSIATRRDSRGEFIEVVVATHGASARLCFTIDKWMLVKRLVAQLSTTIADSVVIERTFNEPR